MIKLVNVKKRYDNDLVLNNVNLEIKENGIYVIKGKSGCGKSTLLNILGMMDDEFEGEYFIDSINVKKVKNKEKIRNEYFTYLYQFPHFIENETVETNIKLSNPTLTLPQIEYYLEKVKLSGFASKDISSLSGGERRRVSLITTLVRRTPIVLCDEVSGALDLENKIMVMELLKDLSKSKIILFVSHEEEIVEKYAKKIIIIENKMFSYKDISPLSKTIINKKKNHFSLHYIFLHILKVLKKKKYRTIISSFTMIVSLVTLGLTISLSSLAQSIVEKEITSQYNKSHVVMELKNKDDCEEEFVSLKQDELEHVLSNYPNEGFTSLYYYDFDNVFIDENKLCTKNGKYVFNEINLKYINEYTYLKKLDSTIYPSLDKLEDDEIILSLSKKKIEKLCRFLQINENIESLGKYLERNPLDLLLKIKNNEWEYKIEINLKLCGVKEDNNTSIIHTSSRWNEYIFEDKMQMLVSYDFNKKDLYPWTLKKISCINVKKENLSSFLNKMVIDKYLDSFSLHLVKETLAPLNNNLYGNERIFLTYKNLKSISLSSLLFLYQSENIESFQICSENSYYLISSALVKGFSYSVTLSGNEEDIYEFCDVNEYSNENLGMYQGSSFYYSSSLLQGDIVSSSKPSSFKINSYFDKPLNLIGEPLLNNDEIIISEGIKDKYKLNLNDYIYLSFLKNITTVGEQYKNEFIIVPLRICGIIQDDKKMNLYAPYYWFESFFIEKIYSESDSFVSYSALITLKEESDEEMINKMNFKYKEYYFSSPLIKMYEELDKTLRIIKVILLAFSLFSLLSSLLMMITVVYLFYEENKYEIAAYFTLGYSKLDIVFYYFSFGLIIGMYSFIISSFNLSFILLMMNESFGIEGDLIMDFKIVSSMFLISLLFSILSALIVLNKMIISKKIDLLNERI